MGCGCGCRGIARYRILGASASDGEISPAGRFEIDSWGQFSAGDDKSGEEGQVDVSFVFIESSVPGRSFHFPISDRDWESRISLVEFFPSNSAVSNPNSVFIFAEFIALVLHSIDSFHGRIRCNSPFLAFGFHDLQICRLFWCTFFMGLNHNCDANILDWPWESVESGIEQSGADLICLNAFMVSSLDK
jgi:hypothetical protein